MVQSNDILFNEPALHSLKRAQLYSLCRRYNIKQTGKNAELIARLRMHAQTMLDQEHDARNSVKSSNSNTQEGPSQLALARSYEEWELVDEDCRAEDISMTLIKRPRTLSLMSMMSIAGKSHVLAKDVNMDSVSSRSSSFKSFASSLKRVGSKSSKLSVSTTDNVIRKPVSQLFPPAQTSSTDRADEKSSEEGDRAEPIVEGTVDATTLDKNQTTIRLVTPPPRPHVDEPLINATPNLRPLSLSFPESSPKIEVKAPLPELATSPRTPAKVPAGHSQGISSVPFVFGSPANAVTNLQFTNAANAILEEMNRRLGLDSDSSAAAKIGADGTLNFGEVTPSQKIFTIPTGNKEEGRFGRAHEQEFEKMDSIANHYSVKLGNLAGTKRKSLHVVENARANGRKVICLGEPKEKAIALPAAKRQKVDGAELVKKPNATPAVTKLVVKNEAKLPERRKSLKGRSNTGASTSRQRPAAAAAAAPISRLGNLRTGAAKVVKNLVSSVVNGPSTATTSKSTTVSKTTAASAAGFRPPVPPKDNVATVQRAPSRQVLSRLSNSSGSRASANAPVASPTRAVTKPVPITRATGPILPVKDVRRPTLTRMATAGLQRGGLPSFQATMGSIRASVSRTTSTEQAKTTATTKKSATESSNVAPAKPVRKASKANPDSSVNSKAKETIATEEWPSRSKPQRDPDFEPDMNDGEQSRSSSPLPAPPASLTSRPLNRRITADSPDADTSPTTEGGKGSMGGRKPRISRSKVIAKVQESRQVPMATRAIATPLKSANVAKVVVARARKSGGLAAKAMLLGTHTDGTKGRASVVAASAEAAMRKARVGVVAGVRRRVVVKA